jgi:NTE family protein
MWIDRYEAQYNFILYQADETLTEWTNRCLRQADEIIFVNFADSAKQLSVIESEIQRKYPDKLTTKQTLLLLHPPSTTCPAQTITSLKIRPHCQHHLHVRLQHQNDYERLARYLAGQTIGLVLSGGAARGIAHVGIVQALREANVPFDIIGGTSFGALASAIVAMDSSVAEMKEYLHQAFHKNPTSDYNWLPYVALTKGKRIDKVLQTIFKNLDVADTWLNMYCVASNTTCASMELFQTGCLWEALRASIALPGILPPVLKNGDFLIDGGIFDNLPIETMVKHYQPAKIIAVEVGFADKTKFDFPSMPSNWSLLRDLFRRQDKRKYTIPTLLGSILDSIMLCSDYKTSQFSDKVDLFLRPDLTKYGPTDWKHHQALVNEGYEYATKFLQQPNIISKLTKK